ncbi:MAG: tetratricopeptide repeat protein [Anaerolineae bacterium]
MQFPIYKRSVSPQYVDAITNRGIVRCNTGDLNGAIADFDEAIRLNPQYANAYSNRGFIVTKQVL